MRQTIAKALRRIADRLDPKPTVNFTVTADRVVSTEDMARYIRAAASQR